MKNSKETRQFARQNARRENASEAERRGCIDKQAFATQRVADRYAAKRQERIGVLFESYGCQFCPHFHVGRTKHDGAYVPVPKRQREAAETLKSDLPPA